MGAFFVRFGPGHGHFEETDLHPVNEEFGYEGHSRHTSHSLPFKGIAARDFGGLQMILMDRNRSFKWNISLKRTLLKKGHLTA